MLETVSSGFRLAKNKLKGQAQLTDDNLSDALQDVRTSLLEADVEFSVVRTFLARVKERTLGSTHQVTAKDKSGKALKRSPADIFIHSCYEELVALMGPVDTALPLRKPVGVVMMVGLQGTGKTTTTGKLAKHLQKQKYKPLLVGADIYRPAAIEQLRVLGEQLGCPVYADPSISPQELCAGAIQKAKEHQCDVVLLDTAGRLTIDDALMNELAAIKDATKPDQILLVADAMMGQDAVRTSLEFNERLSIDGFIMTKLDGDARGGAALSIKTMTGQPIKFLGMGEKLDALEAFRPEGLASRILGMGDIVGLVQDFEEHVDQEEAEKDAERMLKGQFGFDDFLKQMQMIKKMGSFSSLIEKLPGMGDMMPAGAKVDDRQLVPIESLIRSMTPQERKRPDLIVKSTSRKERIARGAGRKPKELSDLLSRFEMMRKMMQAVGQQPGLLGRLPGFGDLAKLSQMGGGGPMGDIAGMLGGPGGPMGGMPPGMSGMGGMGLPPMGGPGMGMMGGARSGSEYGSRTTKKKKKDKRKQARKSRKKRK